MNDIAKEKVAARQEAKAMSDAQLVSEHSRLILKVESMQREGANRLDKLGKHSASLETIEALNMVQAAHAKLTRIAMDNGMIKPAPLSGER